MHPQPQARSTRYLGSGPGYIIRPHPHHGRIYHIDIEGALVAAFFEKVRDTDIQALEYVPTRRFIVAQILGEVMGKQFQTTIREILQDRDSGGFSLAVSGTELSEGDCVRFSTAIAHLIGPSNFDAMSGTFYARFVVKHTDQSDSYLRQAYRCLTLHTDGTYVEEKTDWLLMMKLAERNAKGGESRLLHLDDWEDFAKYATHPLATYPFTYKSPGSKNVGVILQHATFIPINGKICISYIDQFVYPETIEQATYLQNMSNSMESAAGTKAIPLPVGHLVMLNNSFWLHGRAPFEQNTNLHRELLRQRGTFSIA